MQRRLLLAVTFLLCVPGLVLAQSSTGRTRAPVEEEPVPTTPEETREPAWSFNLGAGLVTSGDLFRVTTSGNSGIGWAPPGGGSFVSDDFLVTLDENIGVTIGLGRRLSDRFWARLDFSTSQLNMTAEARSGQTVELYRWDQMTFNLLALTVEYHLVQQPSYPYLLAGGGATKVSGRNTGDYDQTRPSFRFGAGYSQRFLQNWSVRLEIRDTIQDLKFADYQPPVADGNLYPDMTLEELGPQHAVELLLALHGVF